MEDPLRREELAALVRGGQNASNMGSERSMWLCYGRAAIMATHLWAPWRMPYIRQHGQNHGGCFLCENPTDEAHFRERLVLVAQPHAFVCLNRYPFTTSHLLVAPRRHAADVTDLTDEEYRALMELLRVSVVRLRLATGCQAVNVGFNLGEAAGAGVADHLHGHLVPRWHGDTNFMPVLADVRVMPEYLDEAWARLYEAFADVPGARAEVDSASRLEGTPEGPR